jgi:hypothetical protein
MNEGWPSNRLLLRAAVHAVGRRLLIAPLPFSVVSCMVVSGES